jgi:hypothetical protein
VPLPEEVGVPLAVVVPATVLGPLGRARAGSLR